MNSFSEQKIGFVGGGNMAGAFIGGLISAGFNASNITVSDPYEPSLQLLKDNFKVNTTHENNDTITGPNQVLIMSVKPQVMKSICKGLSAEIEKHQPLIISIAAGITIPSIVEWVQAGKMFNPHVVRCMPNTPALVNEGATGIFAPENVTNAQRELATVLLQSISKACYWVDKESLLDVVTGLSGSGPAYFFLMVEAMEKAGVDLGLPPQVARGLAAQTCMGAGKMLTTSPDSPAELRRKVTSPNGTTHAACVSLEANGIRALFETAVKAATDRADELGRVLGEQKSSL